MRLNRIFISFLILFVYFIINPLTVSANPACIAEAKEYYRQYDLEMDIKKCENKYTATDNDYIYAITYVTSGGEVMNLYLNELPSDFNLWNTDIVIKDGRVVVTGVNADEKRSWNLIFSKYRRFIIGVSGIGALTMVLAFSMGFVKLGGTAGNPQGRIKILALLIFTGIGAVGLGSVTIIFGFFWNFI